MKPPVLLTGATGFVGMTVLAELRPAGEEMGVVAMAWSVVNQDGRAVCRARVEVLWRRDDAFVAIPL